MSDEKPDLTIQPDEIGWRVGATFDRNGAKWGMLLGYIDSRLAMEKLDLLDPNWSTRMEPIALNADVGIRCSLTVNGVTREDVGIASNTEPLKGAFSDALKRAAVHFGIGRELYDLPHIAVECNVGANGKVKGPKALPTWTGSRWTIDRNLGWVKYDREPVEQPSAPVRATVRPEAGAVPPRAPAPADDIAIIRDRVIDILHERHMDADALQPYADKVGIVKGERATLEQWQAILALIERPDSDPATEPVTEVALTASAMPPAPSPDEAGQTAAGEAPPSQPAAGTSDPASTFFGEQVAAATGGELLPENPAAAAIAKAEARAAKQKVTA